MGEIDVTVMTGNVCDRPFDILSIAPVVLQRLQFPFLQNVLIDIFVGDMLCPEEVFWVGVLYEI